MAVLTASRIGLHMRMRTRPGGCSALLCTSNPCARTRVRQITQAKREPVQSMHYVLRRAKCVHLAWPSLAAVTLDTAPT